METSLTGPMASTHHNPVQMNPATRLGPFHISKVVELKKRISMLADMSDCCLCNGSCRQDRLQV